MSEISAELERRACGECRADLLEDRKIRGMAVVFDKPSENMGGFREVIRASAVDRTFSESIDVRALVDHDTAKIIGRLTAGTLQLKKRAKGLFVEIDPPNTTAARDILESVSRGDVTGMSFAFQVMPDGVEWTEDDGGFPMREILDMRIHEVSIVTFPAYAATSVDVAKRSLARFLETRRQTKWREQVNEIRRITMGIG